MSDTMVLEEIPDSKGTTEEKWVIEIVGLASDRASVLNAMNENRTKTFLQEFDPTFTHPTKKYPVGHLVGTTDANSAKKFGSQQDAIRFYQQQSEVMPKRPDGYPNRPLTAFHVIFHQLHEVT